MARELIAIMQATEQALEESARQIVKQQRLEEEMREIIRQGGFTIPAATFFRKGN